VSFKECKSLYCKFCLIIINSYVSFKKNCLLKIIKLRSDILRDGNLDNIYFLIWISIRFSLSYEKRRFLATLNLSTYYISSSFLCDLDSKNSKEILFELYGCSDKLQDHGISINKNFGRKATIFVFFILEIFDWYFENLETIFWSYEIQNIETIETNVIPKLKNSFA